MSINWKRPQNKRYQEPISRLWLLFWFIFLELNGSYINFRLCSKRWGKTKRIEKEYDVCLLVSLSILKLVNNLSRKSKPSLREKSRVCTDEELLLIWSYFFGENCGNNSIRNAIGETRRKEIKVPEACAGFYDEKKQKWVRKNNLWSYLNTIPKRKIQECIGYLFTVLDDIPIDLPEENKVIFRKVNGLFVVFLTNFIRQSQIPYPLSHFVKECGGRRGKIWEVLCKDYQKEVDFNTPWTSLERFTEYKSLFPVIRLAWYMPWESEKKQSKNKKV